MFKRILKTLAALGAGHGIQTLTQLLIPPAFIAAYGVNAFGEWLVLAAAVGYLTTLDFGLQTYVVNELTMLYHRRDWEQFHRFQSVGLRLMLGLVGGGTVLSAGVFLLPVAQSLKITRPESEVAWTLFWLALQILLGIAFGQIVGIYRAIGQAHRGVMWGNLQRSLLLAVTLALVWLRPPFWIIALGQFLTVATVLALFLGGLRRRAPEVFPRLDYWDRSLARRILKPSAFFGLLILNQFLIFQAPILILNRLLGPEVVVMFTVGRTLFSFVRQGGSLIQLAIAPEVTRLNGIGDKDKLVRVYRLFESAVLATALIVNVGVLFMAPAILRFWLKRPELFDLRVFLLLMLASILMVVKDFKLIFQYATNNHSRIAVMTLLSYLGMVLISVPAIQWLGVAGFLLAWLLTELLQTGLVHVYNLQVLTGAERISLRPEVRLAFALLAIVPLIVSSHSFLQSPKYLWHGVAATAAMAFLAAVSYFVFDLRELAREGKGQLARVGFGPKA